MGLMAKIPRSITLELSRPMYFSVEKNNEPLKRLSK